MQQSDLPTRFPIPFAASAGASYIRTVPTDPVTPTTTDAPASLTEGFPPECFLPEASGGIPPNGKDFNGILNQITAALRWMAAGGPAIFNSDFSTAIGGYPKGAVLASVALPGAEWISIADNNTTDPDSVGASGWVKIAGPDLQEGASSTWRRIGTDGWIEMGGYLAAPRSTEGAFTLTFPFGGFGTKCLGMSAMTVNASQTVTSQTTIQEVSLTASGAQLFAQSHQSSLNDFSGLRWKAWGY